MNIVLRDGDVGRCLVEHPSVDKVVFTESTSTGRQIAERCVRLLRPVTLELGGKSAAIVFDDADLAETVANLAGTGLLNNGQTCYNTTRVLAPRVRFPEVLDAVTSMAQSLTIGDPLDPDTHVGPVVSCPQYERIMVYIEAGCAEGR